MYSCAAYCLHSMLGSVVSLLICVFPSSQPEVHPLPRGLVHVYGVLSCHNGKEPLVALSALGPGMPTSCGVHGSPAHLNNACPSALDPGVGTLRLAPGAFLCVGFSYRRSLLMDTCF